MNSPSNRIIQSDGPSGGRARRGIVAAALALGALAMPATVMAAEPDTPSAPSAVDDELGPRLERACLRIPNLQIRTDNLLARITGDAETIGSLLWLQVQIDRAERLNREDLVTVLENRLAVRTATVDVLEQRRDGLVELAERCRELGADL